MSMMYLISLNKWNIIELIAVTLLFYKGMVKVLFGNNDSSCWLKFCLDNKNYYTIGIRQSELLNEIPFWPRNWLMGAYRSDKGIIDFQDNSMVLDLL